MDSDAPGRGVNGVGTAPGKVILLGEHAVVFGETALAAALPFGVTVRATRQESGGIVLVGAGVPVNDPRISEALAVIARHVGVTHARLEVESELPIGGGLGSSAAFAVAVCRALADGPLSMDEVNRIALESERIFHGTPSGVDTAVSCHGGIVKFRAGPPSSIERVAAARPLPMVLAFTGRARQTSAKVAGLRKLVAENPSKYRPIVTRLGALAEAGEADVRTGDHGALGAKMSEAQELLAACGLSCEELETIVAVAVKAGALGAKLTGAGGGGAAMALVDDPAPVIAALTAAGFQTRFVELS
jgi:mevalonate kinase